MSDTPRTDAITQLQRLSDEAVAMFAALSKSHKPSSSGTQAEYDFQRGMDADSSENSISE